MRFRQFIFCLFFILVFVQGSLQTAQCSEDKSVNALISKLDEAQHDTTRVNLLLKLANETSWSDIKSAEKYVRQAMKLSQQNNYVKGIAYSNYWLAKIFVDYEYDLSENFVLQALEQAKEINDSILMARVFNVLGNLKSNLNHNEDALFYYNQALDIYLIGEKNGS